MELDVIKPLPYTLHIYITHFIRTTTLLKESYLHLTDSKRENQVDQGPRIDLLPRTLHCPLGRSMQTLERQLRHSGLEESKKRGTACFMQGTFPVFHWCDRGSSFQLRLFIFLPSAAFSVSCISYWSLHPGNIFFPNPVTELLPS